MWTLDEFPNYFLVTAMKEIEGKVGLSYTEWDRKTRVKILLLRYRTFKEVTAEHGTHWNRPEKSVTADDDVWMKIFEPIFNELAMLFGMDDFKIVQSPTVIVISDTTVNLVSGEGDEEVNSPAIFPSNKVKRKLFVDECGASDRESTNHPPFAPSKPSQMELLLTAWLTTTNMQKTKQNSKRMGTPQKASPIASSCASSSPAAWWRNPDVLTSLAKAEARASPTTNMK
ncbi:hypothetical protein SASPL_104963 [Salvia splendens]|uniref:Myb/SANT-like domain-containing protein n=1 Tax=Salvia splendens TaxID=180675 RepID=A0A8X8YPL4_SALSN|nr:hypothetical protein SASPL_104963 [Salvia splendens]